MSRSQWRFDGLDFAVALDLFGRDRLPYPMRHRAEFDHQDDYARARRGAAERLAAELDNPDERLYDTLAVLLEPDVRVEIHGFTGRNLSTVVRVHAGLRRNTCVIAEQRPSPDPDYGSDVTLSRCSVRTATAQIVAALPQNTGGSGRRLAFRASDLGARNTEIMQDPLRASTSEELTRFFGRTRSGHGEITVYPGAGVDNRPTRDGRTIHWLDYPDDGRYLLQHQRNESVVTPAPVNVFMQELQRLITVVERSRERA